MFYRFYQEIKFTLSINDQSVFSISTSNVDEVIDDALEKLSERNKKLITWVRYLMPAYMLDESVKKLPEIQHFNSLFQNLETTKKELDEANYALVDSKINDTYSSGYFQGILARIRKYCIEEYAKYLPDDETGLLAGIVLGIKDNIRYDFYQEMIRSGAVHIAVASGFNLMLLYGFVSSGMFWLFGRKTVTWLLSFILYFYAMIAGLEPPIVRAWIMIVFLMFSQLLGRKLPSWWVLLVSGFLMLVWDIRLLSSVGFQLSMASSFALIVLLPFVKNFCEEKNLKPEFDFLEKLELVTTVLASAITLPIIYWHFGRVSLWGVLSNIFVLPLVPPLMVLGLLMLFAPAVFWIPTYVLSHTLVLLIHFFAN